jgi:hypothetical protein
MSCNNTATNSRGIPFLPRKAPGGNHGSAIVLVVSVGALITLLVFTWVVFSVQRFHAVIEKRDALRARYAAESVISQVIYEKTINPSDSLKRADTGIFISGKDGIGSDSAAVEDPLSYTDSLHASSATAEAADEGSYFRVRARGTSGKVDCAIDALFGIELPPEYRFAAILFGSGSEIKPLEIKRGRIIGDISSTKAPLGTIDGKFEPGATKPIVNTAKFEGEMERLKRKIEIGDSGETVLPTTQTFSGRSMPALGRDKDLFVNGNILIEDRSQTPLVVKGPGTIIATGNIQISGSVIVDNVEILALGDIQCFDNVRIRKATLYSRQMIGFGDKVTVSGNLYATTKLVMAGQATVEIPTFAYIKGSDSVGKKGDKTGGLQLTQLSRFSGIVYSRSEKTVSQIGRDTRFTGLFYTMGYLVLEGTVFGCVAAQSLTEDPEDAQTTNVLAGGTINRKILPKNFVVPCAFGRPGTTFRLVSWNMQSSNGKPKGETE